MSEDVESRIKAFVEAGDHQSAASLAIREYGPSIFALLVNRLRSKSDAEEVFSVFCEKFWIGLPSFEWRCRLQGWAHLIARNCANDFKGAVDNHPSRRPPFPTNQTPRELVDEARTVTANFRRTEARDRVRELREQLDPDDQMLLVLRVDQGMAWRELAVALGGGTEILEGDELEREVARIRKRFQRIKEELRRMAAKAGLL